MNSNAERRLLKDLKKLESEQNTGITATPDEDSLFRWKAVIFGPDETEWEGGVFRLVMEF